MVRTPDTFILRHWGMADGATPPNVLRPLVPTEADLNNQMKLLKDETGLNGYAPREFNSGDMYSVKPHKDHIAQTHYIHGKPHSHTVENGVNTHVGDGLIFRWQTWKEFVPRRTGIMR